MDELVFIIFGVISVLLIGGVLITLLNERSNQQADIALEQSLTHLQAFCDNICQQPEETLKKTDVTLTRDSVLFGQGDSICINDACRRCRCNVAVDLVNLTDAPFRTRDYTCFFHRTQDAVNISCAG